MQVIYIAALTALCLLLLVSCWGAPQWHDDEAQGRHVRDLRRELGIMNAADVEERWRATAKELERECQERHKLVNPPRFYH